MCCTDTYSFQVCGHVATSFTRCKTREKCLGCSSEQLVTAKIPSLCPSCTAKARLLLPSQYQWLQDAETEIQSLIHNEEQRTRKGKEPATQNREDSDIYNKISTPASILENRSIRAEARRLRKQDGRLKREENILVAISPQDLTRYQAQRLLCLYRHYLEDCYHARRHMQNHALQRIGSLKQAVDDIPLQLLLDSTTPQLDRQLVSDLIAALVRHAVRYREHRAVISIQISCLQELQRTRK